MAPECEVSLHLTFVSCEGRVPANRHRGRRSGMPGLCFSGGWRQTGSTVRNGPKRPWVPYPAASCRVIWWPFGILDRPGVGTRSIVGETLVRQRNSSAGWSFDARLPKLRSCLVVSANVACELSVRCETSHFKRASHTRGSTATRGGAGNCTMRRPVRAPAPISRSFAPRAPSFATT